MQEEKNNNSAKNKSNGKNFMMPAAKIPPANNSNLVEFDTNLSKNTRERGNIHCTALYEFLTAGMQSSDIK